MTFFRFLRIQTTLVGGIFGLALTASLSSQDKEESETPTVVPLSDGAMADGAFDLFPVGKPWSEVRVPNFDENDVLTSIMHTVKLTRESEELLLLDGLTLVMFQKNGDMSLRLVTERGVYDVNEEYLKSREKTFIQHPQFDMTGDTMLFNTKDQNGTLNGNVEMIIYDMERAAMPIPTVPLPEIVPEIDPLAQSSSPTTSSQSRP